MPRIRSHRANQKPSRPASNARAIRVIGRPTLTASSRHRWISCSSASSSGIELLQRVALDSRNNSSNEPTRLAHINNHNERALLAERKAGLAQIVRLRHGALHRLIAAPTGSARRRHSIFSGEVEASNTPTIRRLIPSCRHQLSPIARVPGPAPTARPNEKTADTARHLTRQTLVRGRPHQLVRHFSARVSAPSAARR
jgi:hypothetical protein